MAPGTKVAYTVVVRNTGTLPVDATAVDDLSGVLDDAVYDDADASSGTVTYAAPKLSWSGTLQPGQSATVTYSVTVNTPDTGDRKLHNHVTGDRHSNCLTGSEAAASATLPSGAWSYRRPPMPRQPSPVSGSPTRSRSPTRTGAHTPGPR
ncbi:hypothetical protein ACFQ0T_33820 [Kitasatospora gansuensis]